MNALTGGIGILPVILFLFYSDRLEAYPTPMPAIWLAAFSVNRVFHKIIRCRIAIFFDAHESLFG